MQAEVHRVNQMAWHLNMLPSGMPGLKDVKLDEWTCPCITSGAERIDGHAYECIKQCLQHIY